MKRADELLVSLGLVESRSKARALIEASMVSADGVIIDKASRKISDSAKIKIEENADILKYVSRGGLKMEGYLDKFGVDAVGKTVLDIGASTGGFTHCLLTRGAASAVCVDVGTGQLHPRLLSDPRVKNLEQTDARTLNAEILGADKFDILCADLSFISIEKVLPLVWPFLKKGGLAILLVKPQFEAPPQAARKGRGIIKDETVRMEALEKIKNFSAELDGASIAGEMESPIKGGDGNVEYLLGIRKS